MNTQIVFDSIKAYHQDWNPMTAEGYNESKNEAILVFNFDATTAEKANNVIHFVVGRTLWCHKNFPPKTTIKLSFDFRGQGLIINYTKSIKNRILESIDKINIENNILIDFLI